MERLCAALQVDPEDIVMLVLAWKMDAKQMGYFTLNEWNKGMKELLYDIHSNHTIQIINHLIFVFRCDSINKLRNKFDYLRSLLNDPSTFKSVYRYSFDFAKVIDSHFNILFNHYHYYLIIIIII